MRKQEINLLPLSVRKERTSRIYMARARRLYGVGVIAILLVLLMYGAIWGLFWQVGRELGEQKSAQLAQSSNARARVATVNTLLREAHQYSQQQRSWTEFVARALAYAPSELQFYVIELQEQQISPDRRRPVLRLEGVSRSRAAIVAYIAQLEEIVGVERVESPLTNFTSGELVEFSLTIFRTEKETL